MIILVPSLFLNYEINTRHSILDETFYYIWLFITAKQKYFPGVKHLKQKHRSFIIETTYKFSLKIKHNMQIYKAS